MTDPAVTVDVGVIGLGRMGGPIAANLVRAGLSVAGTDVEPSRVAELVAVGGLAAPSAIELAASAPVLLTLLPSVAALESVADEIASAQTRASRPTIVAEMSTLPEDAKRAVRDRLARAGVIVLDCPLSGTAIQAAAGDLVIYASGDAAAIDACAPVFERMSRSIHRLGAFGTGTRTKLVANLLVAIHIVSAAEALALAQAAGLDLDRTLAALTDGAGTSRMLEVRGPMMVAGDFERPSMTLRLFEKDEDLIRAYGSALGVALPLFEEASRELRQAAAAGHAEHDTAAVYAALTATGGPRP